MKIGDQVTRDGTDVHELVQFDGLGPDPAPGESPAGVAGLFRCVVAPATGWTKVGDEEWNMCERYSPLT